MQQKELSPPFSGLKLQWALRVKHLYGSSKLIVEANTYSWRNTNFYSRNLLHKWYQATFIDYTSAREANSCYTHGKGDMTFVISRSQFVNAIEQYVITEPIPQLRMSVAMSLIMMRRLAHSNLRSLSLQRI
jgi:hypothetical protein